MWKNLAQRILSMLCMGTGILLLLYPWISNGWQESRAAAAIAAYAVDKQTTDMAAVRQKAVAYNTALAGARVSLLDPFLPEGERRIKDADYETVKRTIGRKTLGCIEIPAIRLRLPVCMGTEEAVLQSGIGHLEGTSLPVGGESTHAVLTGHTGLHTARLFTDLEMITVGDRFYLDILGRRLTYGVEAVQTVWPEDTEALRIYKGEDRVTLVTCTPYGVNDHRLLVHGVRMPEEQEETMQEKPQKKVSSRWMQTYTRAVCGGLWIVALCRLYVWIRRKR